MKFEDIKALTTGAIIPYNPDKGVKRGFRVIMSEEMFSDIIARAFGLDSGTIEVRHVTGEHWNRSFELSAITTDERFPILTEGAMYPLIEPRVKVVNLENGKQELQYDGFALVEEKPKVSEKLELKYGIRTWTDIDEELKGAYESNSYQIPSNDDGDYHPTINETYGHEFPLSESNDVITSIMYEAIKLLKIKHENRKMYVRVYPEIVPRLNEDIKDAYFRLQFTDEKVPV